MDDGSLCHIRTRVCKLCAQTKPETEFYPIKKWFDSYCKLCRKEYQRDHYRRTLPEMAAYERSRAVLPHRVKSRADYSKSDAGKAAHKRAHEKYYTRNKEKRYAHTALGNAVRDGRIKKMPCEVCGSTYRIHGHHDDYSKPFEVVWLCSKHHSERHKELIK